MNKDPLVYLLAGGVLALSGGLYKLLRECTSPIAQLPLGEQTIATNAQQIEAMKLEPKESAIGFMVNEEDYE